jgi:murein DD-endopeptidase MepM/ murein hydrolase activator NlpD
VVASDCYLGLVASSPTPSGPRHVGLIVDPSVREDGGPDPELHLDPGSDNPPAQAPTILGEVSVTSGPGSEAGPSGSTDREGPLHPVRQRLLERAAAARTTPGVRGLEELSLDAAKPGRPVDLELDLVVGARPPAAPRPARPRAPLSPRLVAVFGTLLGLVTIATIVALAMRLEPRTSGLPTPTTSRASAGEAAPPQAAAVPRRMRHHIAGPWRIQDAKGQGDARIVTGSVGKDPFLTALENAGVATKQGYRVVTAMKGLRNLDDCRSADQFAALIDRASSRVKAFEYIVSKEEVYQAREGADGLLVAQKLDLRVERGQFTGAVAMNTDDLAAEATHGGFEEGLVPALRKALEGHMALDEIRQGDVLRVIVQEVTVLGEFARYAGIEALEYRPRDGSSPLRVYYFRGPEGAGYYDDKGRAPYEGGWRKPIPGARMTSPFNLKRMHPVLKKIMPHLGIDFGAPAGTPIGASSYGTVTFVGFHGAVGNFVRIEHPGGIETGYGHMQRFADGLRVGDKVKRLQTIGYVGSTGRSTGPHLHFSVKKNGEFVDPASLNLDSMRVLSEAERPAFSKAKQEYDQKLDAIPLPAVTAPAPPPAVGSAAPSGEEDVPADLDVGMGPDAAAPAPATSPAPASTVTAGGAPTPAPAAPAGNAVYVTDEELLKSQPSNDDGEVTE